MKNDNPTVAVRIDDLAAGYRNRRQRRQILQHVSHEFRYGAVHAIVGANGAGKSTLIKAIAGLVPSTGGLLIDGRDARTLSPRERACEIAYVPQHLPQAVECSGRDFVRLGRYSRSRRFAGLSAADEQAVAEALQQSGAIAWADTPVCATSGGQQQLSSLTRALAQEPKILLLDEPTSALDIAHETQVMRLLGPWVRADPRQYVIIVVHDLTLAVRYCDEMLLVHDGGIAHRGSPGEVLHPDHIRQAFGVEVTVGRHPSLGFVEVHPL